MKTTSFFFRQIILATLLAFVALPVAAQKLYEEWYEDKIIDEAIEKSKDFEKGYYLWYSDNYGEAIPFLEKAANARATYAMTMLGDCYEHLDNIPKSFYWYSQGAQRGEAPSQYKLGSYYKYGIGVNKDEQKGIMWTSKAAEQGYVHAQFIMGCEEADKNKSTMWFTKAAEQGHDGAQYLLGLRYYRGNGVNKDEAKARYWMQKAADQGQKDAIEWLKNNK